MRLKDIIPASRSISRGVAAFLAGFTLVNLIGEMFTPQFAGNLWWIDLRPMPAPAARAILFICSVLFLAFVLRPAARSSRRWCTAIAAAFVGVVAICNTSAFFSLLIHDRISAFPLPLSLLIAAEMALIVLHVLSPDPASIESPIRHRRAIAAVTLACCVGFPMAQMLCFGHTDYRRRADAIVVFGARAYADGIASQALADRVRTACDLYHDGLADKLVFSGGPGDGAIHETEAMRRLALRAGVPDSSIYRDENGLNTDATVRNTDRLFRELGIRRVLAVSHAYHLPRVKMAYRRAGWDVYTVPAHETQTLRQMPFLITREVAAIWAYYVRAL